MKIGLVGEAPSDTQAIENLLSQQYRGCDFVNMLQRINGSMLDNRKAISRLLRVEYEKHKPDVVIFIRDLDALEKDKAAKKKRQEIFTYSNSIVNKTGLAFLNIYELEALILADVEVFNHRYNCSINNIKDSMLVAMPKEVLIRASSKSKKRFEESHNPEIFSLLRFSVVKQNCRYFNAFIKKFDKKLALHSNT